MNDTPKPNEANKMNKTKTFITYLLISIMVVVGREGSLDAIVNDPFSFVATVLGGAYFGMKIKEFFIQKKGEKTDE